MKRKNFAPKWQNLLVRSLEKDTRQGKMYFSHTTKSRIVIYNLTNETLFLLSAARESCHRNSLNCKRFNRTHLGGSQTCFGHFGT